MAATMQSETYLLNPKWLLDPRKIVVFISLLFGTVLSNSAWAQASDCTGLAYVKPADNYFGEIYLDWGLHGANYPRRGYLPAGVVVLLEEPGEGRRDHRRDNCRFSLKGTIRGHIRRQSVKPLTPILQALGVEESEISAFVAPAHPNTTRPLQIFETADLRTVQYTVQRNNPGVVLAVKSTQTGPADAVKVLFLRNAASPEPGSLEEGYIDPFDDRDLDLDGTFRLFSLQGEAAPHRENEGIAFLDQAYAFWNSLVSQGVGLTEEAWRETSQQLESLATCQREATVTFKLTAEAAFELGFFGASGEGTNELSWSIDKDEHLQFAALGSDQNVTLRLSGLTKCNGRNPFIFQEAEAVIENMRSDDAKHRFNISRAEFYTYLTRIIGENSDLIEAGSRASNIRGSIHPLIIVERNVPGIGQDYWQLFDAVERFFVERIFTVTDVPKQDRFLVILMVMHLLSLWY